MSAFCGSTGAEAAATFLRSILESAGQRVGLIGPTEWTDSQSRYPLRTAEPAPTDLAGLLGRMIDRRCASALLCLSSRAIFRGSAESLTPSETVILNVRAPGLDSDQIQETRRAFSKLARSVIPTGSVIVNADDPDAELLGGVHLDARRVAFSLEGDADVSGMIERLDSDGSRLRLRGFDRDFVVDLRPAGRVAAEAAVAAATAAWSRGIDVDSVIDGLEAVERLSGRLEPLKVQEEVDFRLDHPRSAADLTRSLMSMRSWVPGKLTCVLSECADAGQEASLRSTAERFADRLVLSANALSTSHSPIEGPRLDPLAALELTVGTARPGDGVLLVGGPHWSVVAERARRRPEPRMKPFSGRRSA